MNDQTNEEKNSAAISRRQLLGWVSRAMGVAVSAPVAAAILQGCSEEPKMQSASPVASRQTLSVDKDGALLNVLTETIIPTTDTPGAVSVGVPGFIIDIVNNVFEPEEAKTFVTGLWAMNDAAEKAHGKGLAGLAPEALHSLLTSYNDGLRSGADDTDPEVAFFRSLKELTLAGFFMSEPGATQVLQYAAVPGAFHGCLPLAEVGRAWATS